MATDKSEEAIADEVLDELLKGRDPGTVFESGGLVDALKKLRPNDRPPHLVLNQVGMPKRPEITPADFCEPLDIEPIAIIPFDSQLFGAAANSGRMVSEIDARSPVAETFSQIAHIVTGRIEVKKRRKGALPVLMAMLKRN